MRLTKRFHSLPGGWSRADGQTTAEYGVALTVIALTTVMVFSGLGGAIVNLVDAVVGVLPG